MEPNLSASAAAFSPTATPASSTLSASAASFEPVASTLPLPTSITASKSGNAHSSGATSMTVLGGTGNSAPWTQHEQTLFEHAMRSVATSVPQRWNKISNLVPGRSAKACVQRAKQLHAEAMSKKRTLKSTAVEPPHQPSVQPKQPSQQPQSQISQKSQEKSRECAARVENTNTQHTKDRRKTSPDSSPQEMSSLSQKPPSRTDMGIAYSTQSSRNKRTAKNDRATSGRGGRNVDATPGGAPTAVGDASSDANQGHAGRRNGTAYSDARGGKHKSGADIADNGDVVQSRGLSKRNPRREDSGGRVQGGRGSRAGRGGRGRSAGGGPVSILARGQKEPSMDQQESLHSDSRQNPTRTDSGGSKNPSRLSTKHAKLDSTSTMHAKSESANVKHTKHDSANANTTKPERRKRANRTAVPLDANLAEAMTKQLMAQTYECIVCYDNVKRQQKIWSCVVCYRAFHSKCIHKWSSFATKDRNQSESDSAGWRCPGCQTLNTRRPTQYRCFCGKRRDPTWSPHGPAPHTCGDVCEQPLPHCDHVCNEQCHAGPCATCPVMVQRSCPCGNTVVTVRCSSEVTPGPCGQTCGKLLACGTHTCSRGCHDGPCTPCAVMEVQTCFCGRAEADKACGTGESDAKSTDGARRFTCGGTCGRPLACGNHTCARPCHAGPCGECELLPTKVNSCPCGKTRVYQLGPLRTSCLDAVPTCDRVCNKLLACDAGRKTGHRCDQACHTGPCAACPNTCTVACVCGVTSVDVPCVDLDDDDDTSHRPPCADVCSRKMLCGRHRCTNVCCAGKSAPESDIHTCTLICGKPLRCGKHTCDQLCHRGYCPPCPHTIFQEVACACGKTVLEPPLPCGSPAPTCDYPCARPQACDHPVQHTCHGDDEKCPPCPVLGKKVCWCGGSVLQSVRCHVTSVSCGTPCGRLLCCGDHTCPARCHAGECDGQYKKMPDPPPPSATKRTQKKGTDAWGSDEEEGEAPPGNAPAVGRKGVGGTHAPPVQFAADDAVDSWETLDSGDEEDENSASAGDGGKDGNLGADAAAPQDVPDTCGLMCRKPRDCGHPCPARCHPGLSCDTSIPCRVLVTINCECGRRAATVECGSGIDGDVSTATTRKYASMEMGSRASGGTDTRGVNTGVGVAGSGCTSGLSVTKTTTPPSVVTRATDTAAVKMILCDHKCAAQKDAHERQARNRMMADALGLDFNPGIMPRDEYSDFLVRAATTKRDLIARLERTFAKVVESPELKRQPLPVMKSEDRQVAHELAAHYDLDSASFDPEPKRNVVIFRSDFKEPRIPHPLLSQACSRK